MKQVKIIIIYRVSIIITYQLKLNIENRKYKINYKICI